LSDSGSIQEESAIFGFNAVQIRISTERPEAFDTGSIVLTGLNKYAIVNAIDLVVSQRKKGEEIIIPEDYRDTNVSTKVVKLIMGFAGIRKYTSSH
jgi:UDP-N-acetylglucosamine 2-epimerase (non-hydrolysing)